MAGGTAGWEPVADRTAARAMLTAVLAAIDSCSDDMQVPMLCGFPEPGLEQLQWVEDSFYDYLAEYAMLVGENLQDVRLPDLESRVEALELPPSPAAAELLGEQVTEFAIVLALAGLVHARVGTVLFWAGRRALSRTAQAGAREAVRTVAAQRATLTAAERRLEDLVRDRRIMRKQVLPQGGLLPVRASCAKRRARPGRELVANSVASPTRGMRA